MNNFEQIKDVFEKLEPLKNNIDCCGQWPNYMDKYVRTGTSAL